MDEEHMAYLEQRAAEAADPAERTMATATLVLTHAVDNLAAQIEDHRAALADLAELMERGVRLPQRES